MLRQAVILCGGKGTRLGSLVSQVPKPMLEFSGEPYLAHLIRTVARFPIEEIILLAGFKGDQIFSEFDGKVVNGTRLKVIVEIDARGTLGALINSYDHLDDCFIVLNGDTHLNINYYDLWKFWLKNEFVADACMVTGKVDAGDRYGVVEVDGKHVKAFNGVVSCEGSKTINLGVYIIVKSSLKKWVHTDKVLSLEHHYFTSIVDNGRLLNWTVRDHQFFDFGTPDDYDLFSKFQENYSSVPALFLDRDNTINYDLGYTHDVEDCQICDGVTKFIKKFSRKNYKIFIVSNQSGVGRGYYEEEDVWRFHRHLKKYLATENIFIDDFVFCPHFLGSTNPLYDKDCTCRKPRTGLLEHLEKKWKINKNSSVFVGDSLSDREAAEKFGIEFIPCNCENAKFSILVAGGT